MWLGRVGRLKTNRTQQPARSFCDNHNQKINRRNPAGRPDSLPNQMQLMEITELARVKKISCDELCVRKLLSNGTTVEKIGNFGWTTIRIAADPLTPETWVQIHVNEGFQAVNTSKLNWSAIVVLATNVNK